MTNDATIAKTTTKTEKTGLNSAKPFTQSAFQSSSIQQIPQAYNGPKIVVTKGGR